MTDRVITLSEEDALAVTDALRRHWYDCGGTHTEDDAPLRALLTALGSDEQVRDRYEDD